MRAIVLFTASVVLLVGNAAWAQRAPQDEKKTPKLIDMSDAKEAPKLTPAAELTRAKSLKTKVGAKFTDARLGDVLKEFAAKVDMAADVQLMWTYGPNFPFAKKVSYECNDKPLDAALDELFKKYGDLGYIIVSEEGDKHDGWVLLTTTGERGAKKPEVKLTAEEEADAATKLMQAKSLIDGGKPDKAKILLASALKKYPTAKVSAEVKELLATLEK